MTAAKQQTWRHTHIHRAYAQLIRQLQCTPRTTRSTALFPHAFPSATSLSTSIVSNRTRPHPRLLRLAGRYGGKPRLLDSRRSNGCPQRQGRRFRRRGYHLVLYICPNRYVCFAQHTPFDILFRTHLVFLKSTQACRDGWLALLCRVQLTVWHRRTHCLPTSNFRRLRLIKTTCPLTSYSGHSLLIRARYATQLVKYVSLSPSKGYQNRYPPKDAAPYPYPLPLLLL